MLQSYEQEKIREVCIRNFLLYINFECNGKKVARSHSKYHQLLV